MKKGRQRLPAGKVREAVMGEGWYYKPLPPESTWPKCSSCGVRARILDPEHGECIRCRVVRMKKARMAARAAGG